MVSCIDLVEECVVGVEGARSNQVVAHLDNTNKDDNDTDKEAKSNRECRRLDACNRRIRVKANLDLSSCVTNIFIRKSWRIRIKVSDETKTKFLSDLEHQQHHSYMTYSIGPTPRTLFHWKS